MTAVAAGALCLCAAGALTPVLIVPGDGGNQLEARYDKGDRPLPHRWCRRRSRGWETLWLRTASLLPGHAACWADTVRLRYDRATGTYSNAPGVQVRVPGLGNTSTVEHLDPSLAPLGATPYMAPLVDALARRGYRRGVDVAAAPYDFRRAPSSAPEALDAIVALADRLSAAHGGARVALVSHSMGSLVALAALLRAGPDWCRARVQGWTSFAGAFGGVAKEARLFASGDNEGVPFVDPLVIRAEQRSYETNAWLLPRGPAWRVGAVLATWEGRNYTVGGVDAWLRDVGFPDGALMRRATLSLARGLPAPGVPTLLLHGRGLPTPERFHYGPGQEGLDRGPDRTDMGDGDGTVNLVSLAYPASAWPGAQSAPVACREFPGQTHVGLLSHGPALEALLESLGLEGEASRGGGHGHAASA